MNSESTPEPHPSQERQALDRIDEILHGEPKPLSNIRLTIGGKEMQELHNEFFPPMTPERAARFAKALQSPPVMTRTTRVVPMHPPKWYRRALCFFGWHSWSYRFLRGSTIFASEPAPDDTACVSCGIGYYETFWHVSSPPCKPVVRFERRLRMLHELIEWGEGDGKEADALREEMGDIYYMLSEEEIKRMDELSEALYDEHA